jgi:hypothetical protein
MPKVRAKVKVYVENTLRDAGDVFEYGGHLPDINLEELETETSKASRKGRRTNDEAESVSAE